MAKSTTIQYSPRAPHALQFEVAETVPVKDGEPRKTERSVKGSLHLRPGETLTVTEDELQALKDAPHIAPFVRVLHVEETKKDSPPVAEPKSSAAPSAKSSKPE